MTLVPDVQQILIILAVSDLSRSLMFYRKAFGWAQLEDTPVYAEFALPGGQRLGLYERGAFAHNTGQNPTTIPDGDLAGTEIYFYTDDLAAAISKLELAAARPLSELMPRVWGDEAAYFADPDGNVLVVARPIAKR